MKAARIHAYGHSDQILVEDVARPAPGPSEVLVRIRDAGVNPVDWKIREGWFAQAAPHALPLTLGQDFCGEVIALGIRTAGVAIGDDVYGFVDGAYAEFAIAQPGLIARRPRTVTDAIAAALPTPGLTALQILAEIDPEPGRTILVQGAAGGVGSIATQLCLAQRARVFATASADDAPYLSSLGVERVIDYHSQRFEDHVRGVDAVIDLVGGDVFTRSLDVLADGGMIVTTVGPIDAAARRRVRAVHLVMNKNRADLERLARLVDQGAIDPRGARVLPLDHAGAAQDLSQRGIAEKLVLAPA